MRRLARPAAVLALVAPSLAGRGRYVFCNLWMARKASLLVTDPAEIDVVGDATVGLARFTGVAGPARDASGARIPGVPTELRFFVAGRSVKIGTAASLPHLCAPAATLAVGHGGTLEGSFVARILDVRHVTGPVAISATPRCGDASPDVGEECGDGCESDCTITPPRAFVRDVGTNQAKAAGGHVAVTIADTIPVGHTIVVTVAMPNVTGSVKCGDTAGNAYTVDAQATNPGAAAGGLRTFICSAYVTSELAPAVGTPMPGVPGDQVFVDYPTTTAVAMAVYEFENLSPHPLHEKLAASGASTGPQPPIFFTTSAQNALIVTSIATATSSFRGFTPGTGWTALTPFATKGTGQNSALFPEYGVTIGGDNPIAWKFGDSHAWALATASLR